MKISNRTMRLAMVIAASAAVSMPLLTQLTQPTVHAQNAPPATSPKGAPVNAMANVPADKVVLSVGDTRVTAGEFKAFFSELDPQVQAKALSDPAYLRQLGEEFGNLRLMSAEARKLKLDESERVKITYEQLLANALMMKLSEQKDANEQFFKDNREWFSELQMRHILIGTAGSGVPGAHLSDADAHAKAEDLKRRLDKGEDFATLARNESDDKGSAATGGSLGTVSRGQMVKPFEDEAFTLKDNQISPPVKTQYGWHIIQVLSHSIPPYEQVAQQVPRRRLELMLDQLRNNQKPQLDDQFFGASPDAPATKPTTAPAGK